MVAASYCKRSTLTLLITNELFLLQSVLRHRLSANVGHIVVLKLLRVAKAIAENGRKR